MKKSGSDVKTTSMMNKKNTKEIIPLKIILDTDCEIRATNFYGTTKTGRSYVAPQIVFTRATGQQMHFDISFPISQLDQIINSLKTIRDENDKYFDFFIKKFD